MATDGGHAFPFVQWRTPDGMTAISQDGGMSLRDWFAGQALIAIFAVPNANGSPTGMAEAAYDLADAMLAARSAGRSALSQED